MFVGRFGLSEPLHGELDRDLAAAFEPKRDRKFLALEQLLLWFQEHDVAASRFEGDRLAGLDLDAALDPAHLCDTIRFDWATTDRLHQKGLIGDPVNKSKSLVLTDEGLRRSEELFRKLFTRQPGFPSP
jgi:hypothetical protein